MLQAIIGGFLKGTKLTSLSGSAVRPTAARVREAVFNILQHDISGRSFIDVFAGNGGMGLEALSRGAQSVTFVEKDSKAAKVITANIDHCRSRYSGSSFAEGAPWPSTTVIPRDAFRLEPSQRYDFVWMDPPYELFAAKAPAIIELASGLVAAGGRILLESDEPGAVKIAAACTGYGEADDDHSPAGQISQRRYGKSVITILTPSA